MRLFEQQHASALQVRRTLEKHFGRKLGESGTSKGYSTAASELVVALGLVSATVFIQSQSTDPNEAEAAQVASLKGGAA